MGTWTILSTPALSPEAASWRRAVSDAGDVYRAWRSIGSAQCIELILQAGPGSPHGEDRRLKVRIIELRVLTHCTIEFEVSAESVSFSSHWLHHCRNSLSCWVGRSRPGGPTLEV
ncbi:hypothetical protein RRG08_039498 [Elysia crispata]|uniref:Uncharacterized protein n=1 Tax=Elysia crispata TaxID=231223 RepID=A0AAE1D029_9GAST|nr:hypothetical protein RRG08_039498 [Elysia crispata]